VALFVTDAPADPSLYSEITALMTRIDMLAEGTNAPVSVREEAITVDLMNLRNDPIPLSYREGVPDSRCRGIGPALESVELVLTDGTTEFGEPPGGAD
jgi:hypothetical protein